MYYLSFTSYTYYLLLLFIMDEENIRTPDRVHRDQLIQDHHNYYNHNQDDEDLKRVLEMSLQDIIKENELENMIHQSILDEMERNQKIELEIKKREEELQLILTQRKKKYGLLLNRIKLIIQKNSEIKDTLCSIFEKYFSSQTLYTYISEKEYEIFSDFLHYIYSIPKYQKSRMIINDEDYDELIKNIVTKDTNMYEEELYYFHKNWINDSTKNQILEKNIILQKVFM